jgi:hypothetical protein
MLIIFLHILFQSELLDRGLCVEFGSLLISKASLSRYVKKLQLRQSALASVGTVPLPIQYHEPNFTVWIRVADQDPVLFWPLDPGWVKNLDPDPGTGMNILDQISESLEKKFGLKILNFFDADPDSGSGIFWPGIRDGKIRIRDGKIRIRDKHPGSATLAWIRSIFIQQEADIWTWIKQK